MFPLLGRFLYWEFLFKIFYFSKKDLCLAFEGIALVFQILDPYGMRWGTKQKEMKLKQQTKDVSSSGSSGPFDLNTPRCPLHQQKYNLLGPKNWQINFWYSILNYNTNHMSHFYTWVVESNWYALSTLPNT